MQAPAHMQARTTIMLAQTITHGHSYAQIHNSLYQIFNMTKNPNAVRLTLRIHTQIRFCRNIVHLYRNFRAYNSFKQKIRSKHRYAAALGITENNSMQKGSSLYPPQTVFVGVIPPANCVCGRVFCFHVIRLNVRPTHRPNVRL